MSNTVSIHKNDLLCLKMTFHKPCHNCDMPTDMSNQGSLMENCNGTLTPNICILFNNKLNVLPGMVIMKHIQLEDGGIKSNLSSASENVQTVKC